MSEHQSSNIIDFNIAKQLLRDRAELEKPQSFEISVVGHLPFDLLDDFIGHLKDQGLDVESYCLDPSQVDYHPVIIKGLTYDPLPTRTQTVDRYLHIFQEN